MAQCPVSPPLCGCVSPAGADVSGRAEAREPWRTALADAVRDPDDLITVLGLPDTLREPARAAAARFPMAVPRGFMARMRRGDPSDPLLLQVLPRAEESVAAEGDRRDPVGDAAATVVPGLIHKYAGRVVLIASGTCAMCCRYCFRRHFAFPDVRGGEAWAPALAHIARDRSIREVILSGGDPLVLGDDTLGALIGDLAEIAHVVRVRIHTRVPVVIPERVTVALIDVLRGTRLVPVVVVHANHAAELDAQAVEGLRRLAGAGIALLNQSVLLRGVNDDVAMLAALSEALVAAGVMPYYLHQLDRVEGAAHFLVPEMRGREILRELERRLPGYAVPRYVKEVAGEPCKVRIGG